MLVCHTVTQAQRSLSGLQTHRLHLFVCVWGVCVCGCVWVGECVCGCVCVPNNLCIWTHQSKV